MGSPFPYFPFLIHADHCTILYVLFLDSSKKNLKKTKKHKNVFLYYQKFQNSNAIEMYPSKETANPQSPSAKFKTTTLSLHSLLLSQECFKSDMCISSQDWSIYALDDGRHLHVGHMKGIIIHLCNKPSECIPGSMTSTEIPGNLTKARPMTCKCTLEWSSHGHGTEKPSLLPHD